MATKKLIEVALPLDKINDGCVQEKKSFSKKTSKEHAFVVG